MEYERLSYEIALRTLDRQERGLEELRARTGLLLGAASLAVSFLGREAFERDVPAALALVALGSFIVSVGASVYILLPNARLVFGLAGAGMHERLYAHRADIAEVYRRLSYEFDRLWMRNDNALRPVVAMYRVAATALSVEVLALVALASGRLF